MTARFDRQAADQRDERVEGSFKLVHRLHQEDFCQLLGKLPEHKYEQPGQHYARTVRDTFFAHSQDPVRDIEQFARTLIVNAVVGNCDGHLKNFSISRGADWRMFRLAPAYDIASTVVYEGLDRHMAMAIGSTNKIDAVTREDFLQLAKGLSVSQRAMARYLDEVCAGIAEAKDGLVDDLEAQLGVPLQKLRDISGFAQRKIDALGASGR